MILLNLVNKNKNSVTQNELLVPVTSQNLNGELNQSIVKESKLIVFPKIENNPLGLTSAQKPSTPINN
jgi:hypothetical protein